MGRGASCAAAAAYSCSGAGSPPSSTMPPSPLHDLPPPDILTTVNAQHYAHRRCTPRRTFSTVISISSYSVPILIHFTFISYVSMCRSVRRRVLFIPRTYSERVNGVVECGREARASPGTEMARPALGGDSTPLPLLHAQINSPPPSYYRFISPTVHRALLLNAFKPYALNLEICIEYRIIN